MTEQKQSGRIAAETIDAIQPWILPPVNDNGRVLSTAEKEAKERKEALLRKSKESIQTIEMPDQTSPLKGMTAEELELSANSSNSEAHPHLGRCTEHQHNRVLDAFQSTCAETCLFSRPYRSMVAKREFRCFRRHQQLVDTVLNARLELLVD